jgi:hypothetical protein
VIGVLLALGIDLAVHELPADPTTPGLAMRAPAPVATHAQPAPPSTTAMPAPTSAADLHPLASPAESPELHYKLDVGYGIGAAHPTGVPAATGFDSSRSAVLRSFMFGDVALGTRGLPAAPIDTYLQASYYYDFLGARADTPFTTVYDRDAGRAVLARAAYAEVDPSEYGGAPVWLRAGRQYRAGADMAHFDGATVGASSERGEVSAFVGQRVALYGDVATGILGGGEVHGRLPRWASVSGDAGVDVLAYKSDLYTLASMQVQRGQTSALVSLRLLDAAVSEWFARVSFEWAGKTCPVGAVRERSSGLCQARRGSTGLDGRFLPAPWRARVWGEAAEVTGQAPVFDYVTSSQVGRLRYFTLPELAAFTRLRAGVDVPLVSELELSLYAAGQLVHGTAPAPGPARTGYDVSFAELGALLDYRPGLGLSVYGGYRARLYDRAQTLADGGPPRLDDPASAGPVQSHELLLDGRYTLGPHRLTTTAGVFMRYERMRTPFIAGYNDLRAGVRFELESWLAARVRIKLSYELADPSPALSPNLDTLQTLLVVAETSF